MACPTSAHWAAAKSVARYIAGSANWGLTYRGSSGLAIEGCCDADYAGDPATRRTTTGFVFLTAGAAISWTSKRQAVVTASTTEAVYVAPAAAEKEALGLSKLRNDLQLGVDPPMINGDNQGALKLLRNPIASQRSKHIDVVYKFARERAMRGEVAFRYVSTHAMVADSLTKALSRDKHQQCCKGMGLEAIA
jgi:hypothetical protein